MLSVTKITHTQVCLLSLSLNLSITLSLSLNIYIYIYIYISGETNFFVFVYFDIFLH